MGRRQAPPRMAGGGERASGRGLGIRRGRPRGSGSSPARPPGGPPARSPRGSPRHPEKHPQRVPTEGPKSPLSLLPTAHNADAHTQPHTHVLANTHGRPPPHAHTHTLAGQIPIGHQPAVNAMVRFTGRVRLGCSRGTAVWRCGRSVVPAPEPREGQQLPARPLQRPLSGPERTARGLRKETEGRRVSRRNRSKGPRGEARGPWARRRRTPAPRTRWWERRAPGPGPEPTPGRG